MGFNVVLRGGGRGPESAELVSLRRGAIAFNSKFVRGNDLTDVEWVTIHEDAKARKLGFEFHPSKPGPQSLKFSPDGGRTHPGRRAESGGRVVQASGLMNRSWVRDAVRPATRVRHFQPVREDSLWVISIGPAFELAVATSHDLPSGVTGVYRYLDDGEVVYIGRGNLRVRSRDQVRKEWKYDTIEYSTLDDSEMEELWESEFIKEHKKDFGCLPRENRASGTRQSTKED